MKRRRKAIGLVHAAIGVSVLGAAAVGAVSSWSLWARTLGAGAATASTEVPLLGAGANAALQRARITPQALAAAGLDDAETTALIMRVADWWAEHGTTCASACSAADSAGITLDSLRRKAQSGLATGDDLTALSSATSAYATATSAHASQMEAIWEAAVEGLESGKAARLLAIRDHVQAGRLLPVPYLVVERTASDTLVLRDALAEVAADGENAASAATSLVNAANGDGTVSTAKTNLTNNLGEVVAAWSAALAG